jgi:hypothetical protein
VKTPATSGIPLESLALRGAAISSLQIEPLKKVSIRVFTFGEGPSDRRGGREYELLFTKIAGFRLTSFHLPARIEGHSLRSDSEFINDLRKGSSPNSARINLSTLRHYQLVTEAGQIDVASEIVVCVPTWEP